MGINFANNVIEIVTTQIKLGKENLFHSLHEYKLLPILISHGVHPIGIFTTQLGRSGRFYGIFAYENLYRYQIIADDLIKNPNIESYYTEIKTCIEDTIDISLVSALNLPGGLFWKR